MRIALRFAPGFRLRPCSENRESLTRTGRSGVRLGTTKRKAGPTPPHPVVVPWAVADLDPTNRTHGRFHRVVIAFLGWTSELRRQRLGLRPAVASHYTPLSGVSLRVVKRSLMTRRQAESHCAPLSGVSVQGADVRSPGVRACLASCLLFRSAPSQVSLSGAATPPPQCIPPLGCFPPVGVPAQLFCPPVVHTT